MTRTILILMMLASPAWGHLRLACWPSGEVVPVNGDSNWEAYKRQNPQVREVDDKRDCKPPKPEPPVDPPPKPAPPPDRPCTSCPVPDPTPVTGSPYQDCRELVGHSINPGTLEVANYGKRLAVCDGVTVFPDTIHEFEHWGGVKRVRCMGEELDVRGLQYAFRGDVADGVEEMAERECR